MHTLNIMKFNIVYSLCDLRIEKWDKCLFFLDINYPLYSSFLFLKSIFVFVIFGATCFAVLVFILLFLVLW